jgi:subtilisin family serine protease
MESPHAKNHEVELDSDEPSSEDRIMRKLKYEGSMTNVFILLVVALFCLSAKSLYASPFTPLEWQQTVLNGPLAGQKKLQHSVLDTNHNFIDDKIDALQDQVVPLTADIIVYLNKCLSSAELEAKFLPLGNIQYQGNFLTFLSMDRIPKPTIAVIASHPDVAFVEMATPFAPLLDISARAIEARSSAISPGVNEGLGVTGKGVNIAILDTGVDDAIHEAFTGRFRAGFNAVANLEENPDDKFRAPDMGVRIYATPGAW